MDLERLFARFDDDHSGGLIVSELSMHLGKLLPGVLSAAEQRQLFASFDLDRNGVVDSTEFAMFCRAGRHPVQPPGGGGYEAQPASGGEESDGGGSAAAMLHVETIDLLDLVRPAASQFDERCWLYVVLWLEQPAGTATTEPSVIGSHLVRTKVKPWAAGSRQSPPTSPPTAPPPQRPPSLLTPPTPPPQPAATLPPQVQRVDARSATWKKQAMVLHPPELPHGVSLRAKIIWRGHTEACIATASVPLTSVGYGSTVVDAPLQMKATAGKAAPTGLLRPGQVRPGQLLRKNKKQRKEPSAPEKAQARLRLHIDLRV